MSHRPKRSSVRRGCPYRSGLLAGVAPGQRRTRGLNQLSVNCSHFPDSCHTVPMPGKIPWPLRRVTSYRDKVKASIFLPEGLYRTICARAKSEGITRSRFCENLIAEALAPKERKKTA